MNDVQCDIFNVQTVVNAVLQGITTVSNRKRKTKNAEIYLRCGGGYDTESTTITNSDNKPKCAFVYHVQISINGTYIFFRDINFVATFFTILCESIKKIYWKKNDTPHLIIWCANVAHEWAFAKMQLQKVGISEIFAKDERNPLKITLQDVVEIRECIGLFGHSLSDIAKKYCKHQKSKDLDYNKIRHLSTPIFRKEYKYMKLDVQILDELSYVAFEKFTEKGYKMPLTITSVLRQRCKMSIKNIKWVYAENEKIMPKTVEEYTIFRKYMYNGGLSGSNNFYVGKLLKNVVCADITSDYPSQMVHEMFPAGELVESTPTENNIARYIDKFRIYLMILPKIKAKTTHSTLSVHKIMNRYSDVQIENNADLATKACKNLIVSNGKIVYGENIFVCMNDIDIKALQLMYELCENPVILRFWYFTKKAKIPKYLFDNMMLDYRSKNELKKQGKSETTEYKECKANVNSYYGMTVTRLYDMMCIYSPEQYDIIENPAEKTYQQLREKVWLNPFIGYWVTSYARLLLITYIAKYPELIVQYDTDSLYYIRDYEVVDEKRVIAFENDLKAYNTKIMQINNGIFKGDENYLDLGTWDIEKPCKQFKCLGAKRYIIEKDNGKLKPVVAGMVKESFIEYVKENNINPFDMFDNNMILNSVVSKKLGSQYHDLTEKIYNDNLELTDVKLHEPDYIKVTDYKNNTEIVEIGTYHALFPIEFTMKVGKTFLEICHEMQIEKAYPQDKRKFTNMLKKLLTVSRDS